jgi:hypothetical protein
MKHHNIRTTIVTIACLALLGACREDIDIPLNTTNTRLVVEGYFTTDTMQHKVKLTKSGDALFKDSVKTVSNANVTISDGSIIYNLTEDPANKGTYLTAPNVYGVMGKTYTLRIKNVDVDGDGQKEEYAAVSELKKEYPLDSVQVVYQNTDRHMKGWVINLYALDAGGRNYYLIKVLKNKTLITDSVFKYSITNNIGFEGKYYDGFQAYYLEERKPNECLKTGDTLTVAMYGITEAYYHYLFDFITEYYPKLPIFSGPSANISTNIEPKDKAAGFFAATSVQRQSTIYK